MIDVFIILLALSLLMVAAYRGASVILFAPIAALLAVGLLQPALVLPAFSGIYMERVAGFVKLYFPVFLLGAIFGKMMEISGFAKSIIARIMHFIGPNRAIATVVFVCALLTYGGVSLFVVAFAVYPFAAELFANVNIPKRLIPATIALGAFTFTMDAMPGSPQIQNIIPTTFFGTTGWAAPQLGLLGSVVIAAGGLYYLETRRKSAQRAGESYSKDLARTPPTPAETEIPLWVALFPLFLVGGVNFWLTGLFKARYHESLSFRDWKIDAQAMEPSKLATVWAVECALGVAILFVLFWMLGTRRRVLAASLNPAIGGALLAALNTGSEYGFGAVIAALPGFRTISDGIGLLFHDPLVNVAVTSNVLAGITGSASGGMGIVLAAFGDAYMKAGAAAGVPNEVLHRVVAMASGGMDTLPHNGAVITLFAITGLTHRESYKDIFALTVIKTGAVGVVIAAYYWLGLV